MQAESLRLVKQAIGPLPVIEHFMERLDLRRILSEKLGHQGYVDGVLLLIKSILVRPAALYRIREWAEGYDPALVYGGKIGDDILGRALDRLFDADRATMLTRVIVRAVQEFQISTDDIHNDSTTVKVCGAFTNQSPKGVQLKRGHSKDHRPDLKQLLYVLSVSGDGAVPMHCNILDGNVTDDTTHWDTWQALRGMLGRSDFTYIADSKLCVKETLLKIDRAQGRFVTIVPHTRKEVAAFYEELHQSSVRWEKLCAKRSSRKKRRLDIFEIATGFYQLQEGFRLYWYRSSEKARRDAEARAERVVRAKKNLSALSKQRKGPRTIAGCKKAVDRILARYQVADLLTVSIEAEHIETFRQTSRGKPTAETTYKRVVKSVPKILIRELPENLARAKASDGVFPLVTNTSLTSLEILKKYKHQPMLEKRHSLFKSVLEVAPVFLKHNTRITALVFVHFIAQLIAALIEREVRLAMKTKHIVALPVLPEERLSLHPSAAQILGAFSNNTKSLLYNAKYLVKLFVDPISPVQTQILKLLAIPQKIYL